MDVLLIINVTPLHYQTIASFMSDDYIFGIVGNS